MGREAFRIVFAALAVPVVVLIGDRLFSRATGLVAGLLLAVNPFLVEYAQNARSYALVVLLVALSSYFFVVELQEPSRYNRAGYVAASSLAIYAHYFAFYVLLAQAATLVLVERRAALNRKWLVTAGTVVALCAPEVVFAYRDGSGGISWIPDPTLHDLVHLSIHLAGTRTSAAAMLGLGCFAIACAALGRNQGKHTRWGLTYVAAWFLVPILLAFLISFMKPMFLPYYLIVCVPALVLAAAAGAVQLPGRFATAGAILILVGFSVKGLSTWYSAPVFGDYRSSVGYVAEHLRPGDAVLAEPEGTVQPVNYYLHQDHRGGSVLTAQDGEPVPLRAERLWLVHWSGIDVNPGRQVRIQRVIAGRYGRGKLVLRHDGIEVILYQAAAART